MAVIVMLIHADNNFTTISAEINITLKFMIKDKPTLSEATFFGKL